MGDVYVKLDDVLAIVEKNAEGMSWSENPRESGAGFELMKRAEALRALPVSDGWEDIATAPRDGTVVWVYGTISGDWGYTPDRKDMAKAVYHSNRWCFAQPMGRHDPSTWQPTHWRPLPAPPSD